jgi:hypothetical protein
MKYVLSGQIFNKYSNIKFHKNPSSVSRFVPCGRRDGGTDRQTERQADRHDEADICFSKYLERH